MNKLLIRILNKLSHLDVYRNIGVERMDLLRIKFLIEQNGVGIDFILKSLEESVYSGVKFYNIHDKVEFIKITKTTKEGCFNCVSEIKLQEGIKKNVR